MASLIKVDDAGLNSCIAQSLASMAFLSNFNQNSTISPPKVFVELFEIFGEMRKLPAQFQRIC